ncbi:hypothetical protein X975_26897, partial [Stegodyphus mimosarum]
MQKKYDNKHATQLSKLNENDKVWYKRKTKEPWKQGIILKTGPQPRSYVIKVNDGTVYRRNQYHIRKHNSMCKTTEWNRTAADFFGLGQSAQDHPALVDDDKQNPPEEQESDSTKHSQIPGNVSIEPVLRQSRSVQLKGGLTAVCTKLGWTVCGALEEFVNHKDKDASILCASLVGHDFKISDLWSLEMIGILNAHQNSTNAAEEEIATEQFLNSLSRNKDGRYCIRVPWVVKSHPFLLGDVISVHLAQVPKEQSSIAQKLHTSFYIDNCVTSVDNEKELVNFEKYSTEILAEVKMDLIRGPMAQ